MIHTVLLAGLCCCTAPTATTGTPTLEKSTNTPAKISAKLRQGALKKRYEEPGAAAAHAALKRRTPAGKPEVTELLRTARNRRNGLPRYSTRLNRQTSTTGRRASSRLEKQSEELGSLGTWEARVRNTDENKLNTLLLTNPMGASYVECGWSDSNVWVQMGWYCNTIAVDPADPDTVWAAGVDLFRSDDGGRNWGLEFTNQLTEAAPS